MDVKWKNVKWMMEDVGWERKIVIARYEAILKRRLCSDCYKIASSAENAASQ